MSWDSFFGGTEDRRRPISGVMLAVVTNNEDPEGLGRVKLKLPLREIEDETEWTPVASLMAGQGYGSFFIPEVDDQVLVAFHLGDIRQPYVIGSLWNQKRQPPEASPKGNHIRKVRSRSGHEITWNDEESKKSLTIQTAGSHNILLDDQDKKITIAESGGAHSITLEGSPGNKVTIKSGSATLTLDKTGNVVIEGSQKVEIKSSSIAVKATATMELEANASLSLKSNGVVTIKGSVVKLN